MTWPRFLLALACVYLAQTTVARLAPAASLDLFLALALFVALAMPPADGRIAGFLAGFAQSLGSSGPLGLHALSLGGAAWAATAMRARLNTRTFFPRWLVALFAALAGQLGLRIVQTLILGHAVSGLGDWLRSVFLVSLLASAIAAAVAGARPFARVARRDFARRL